MLKANRPIEFLKKRVKRIEGEPPVDVNSIIQDLINQSHLIEHFSVDTLEEEYKYPHLYSRLEFDIFSEENNVGINIKQIPRLDYLKLFELEKHKDFYYYDLVKLKQLLSNFNKLENPLLEIEDETHNIKYFIEELDDVFDILHRDFWPPKFHKEHLFARKIMEPHHFMLKKFFVETHILIGDLEENILKNHYVNKNYEFVIQSKVEDFKSNLVKLLELEEKQKQQKSEEIDQKINSYFERLKKLTE